MGTSGARSRRSQGDLPGGSLRSSTFCSLPFVLAVGFRHPIKARVDRRDAGVANDRPQLHRPSTTLAARQDPPFAVKHQELVLALSVVNELTKRMPDDELNKALEVRPRARSLDSYGKAEEGSKGLEHPDALVSVIIPCHNSSAFLEEALRSALAQTHPDIEVVVVDDGSTDSSPEIAQRFAVRYLRQPNSGVSQARNLGIRESNGTYLVFLDADDRLRPEAVEVGLRALVQQSACAMAVGDHCFISADGSFKGNSRKAHLSTIGYEALLESNIVEMISSVLFRRSVLVEFGGFDTELRVAEDYDLYLRIARSNPICRHPAVVAEYRKHGSNISHNPELMLTTTLRVLRRELQVVQNNPRRLRAFRKGIRTWQRQYGRQLAMEVARSVPRLGSDDVLRKLLLLAREYPPGVFASIVLRAFGCRYKTFITGASESLG